MSTITPESPEQDIRIAMAAVHRTIATLYGNTELPLLKWEADQFGQIHAFVATQTQLDPFAEWLDNPAREVHTTEKLDHHKVVGSKEGVPVKVTYIVELQPWIA